MKPLEFKFGNPGKTHVYKGNPYTTTYPIRSALNMWLVGRTEDYIYEVTSQYSFNTTFSLRKVILGNFFIVKFIKLILRFYRVICNP